MIYANFRGRRLIVLGFGSIGPAVLPLIMRHVALDPGAVTVIAADDQNRVVAEHYGARFIHQTITQDNHEELVGRHLGRGDVLLNLSVRVSSLDLVALCHKLGALYLDTSNETWPGQTDVIGLTTYDRRQRAVGRRRAFADGPTALICHGANPGLVSHFTKQALIELAELLGQPPSEVPVAPLEWAQLAQRLGVVRVHISERDTQRGVVTRSADEYVNTWSVDGFLDEASESAGLVWGTHEDDVPEHLLGREREADGCKMVELRCPGGTVPTKSWVPGCGGFEGYLISHPEAYSIAQLLTIPGKNHRAAYCPTVHFVYRPCEDALASMHDAASKSWGASQKKRLLFLDVATGRDELGILLMVRGSSEAYWYGSELGIDEARRLAPHNNATSLQVAAGVLAGLVWTLENPRAGLIEPEQVDFRRALDVAGGYLGRLGGQRALWNPSTPGHRHPQPLWKFQDMAVFKDQGVADAAE